MIPSYEDPPLVGTDLIFMIDEDAITNFMEQLLQTDV